MLRTSAWPMIFRHAGNIPERFLKTAVKPEIAAAVGSPIDEMFPGLAANFPMATQAMKAHWSTPILAATDFAGVVVAAIVLEGSDRNVFFDLGNFAVPVQGAQFDSYVAMLPIGWRELYRLFWSFTISSDPVPGMYWRNTPTSYASRLRLPDWVKLFKGGTAKAKAFAKQVGSEQLRGWLCTDSDDSLWIDEQSNDQQVYHVRAGAFDDVIVLTDPTTQLDRYLAHVLSGSSPAGFDFRA